MYVCALCACLVLVEARLLSLLVSPNAGIAGLYQYAQFYVVLGIKSRALCMLGTPPTNSAASLTQYFIPSHIRYTL